MNLSRRGLITGLISFVAAPAVVRASSLMPVKPYKKTFMWRGIAVVYDEVNDAAVGEILKAQMDKTYQMVRAQIELNLYGVYRGDAPGILKGL